MGKILFLLFSMSFSCQVFASEMGKVHLDRNMDVEVVKTIQSDKNGDPVTLKKNKRIRQVLSLLEINRMERILATNKCTPGAITIFTIQHSELKLIETDCPYPPSGEPNETVYPMTIAVDKFSMHLLTNLSDFEFMYQTGEITEISDSNHDGRIEITLSGTVNECDGGGIDCKSDGNSFVEDYDGKLRVFNSKLETNNRMPKELENPGDQ